MIKMANLAAKNLLFLTLIQNQKRFLSTAIAAISTSPLQSSVEFLVRSCGLSTDSALSISQKLNLNKDDLKRPQEVINFFKSNGFDDAHITKLVTKYPPVLFCGVERNLKPKREYFIQNGYKGTIFTELLVLNPKGICGRNLHATIIPLFEFMKEFLGTNENVTKALKRAVWMLHCNMNKLARPKLDFLIQNQVPLSYVSKFLLLQPRILMVKHDEFIHNFNATKELGIDPSAPMFVHCFRVVSQLSESTLKTKTEAFRSLGWSEEDIWSMIKGTPACFSVSQDIIKSKMDYLVNTMKIVPEFVIAHPSLLTLSISRIRLRCQILQVLESKKLLQWNDQVAWSLIPSEKEFIKKFVDKYKQEVSDLPDIYQAAVKAEKIGINTQKM